MQRSFSFRVPIEIRIHSGKWYPPIGRVMTPSFCMAVNTFCPSPTRTRMKLACDGTYSSFNLRNSLAK